MADLARLAEALQRSGNAFCAGAAGAGRAPPQEMAGNRHFACPGTAGFCRGSTGAGGAQEEEPAPAAPALPRQVPRLEDLQKPQKTASFQGGAPPAPAAPAEKSIPNRVCTFGPWRGAFSEADQLAFQSALPAARRQQVSWADPLRRPLPGDWCSCCLGSLWWSLEDGTRGWCCSTCHPPAASQRAVVVVRTWT